MCQHTQSHIHQLATVVSRRLAAEEVVGINSETTPVRMEITDEHVMSSMWFLFYAVFVFTKVHERECTFL